MNARVLKNRVERVNALATIPGVLKRLLELIEQPTASLSEISHFVQSDAGLATKVLKMVNSPVYGFPRRISSVNQGVILLGLNVVRALLFGVTVFDLMQKAMVGLWEHSLGCAIVSRLIARRKGLKDPEEVSVYGLLHDIGKVILVLQVPGEYEKVVNEATADNVVIHQVEERHFSTTHAKVGAWIAEKWSFPGQLVDAIEHHHRPHLSKKAPLETAITHLADILLRARGFGFPGDYAIPPVNEAAWKLVDLSERDIREILREAEGLLEEAEELSF